MAWTQNQKIAAGVVGAGVVGGIAYFALRKKDEPAAAAPAAPPVGGMPVPPTTPATPPAKTIDAMWAASPAVALDPSTMPILRPVIGGTAGSTYWILGDETAKDFAIPFEASVGTDNAPTGLVSSHEPEPNATFIADFGAQLSSLGVDNLAPADVWLLVLGKNQSPSNVGAMKESIATIRGKLPTQRILWVLTKSVPASIAQAIGESKEEWFRSSSDSPAVVAAEAIKAVKAGGVADINAAFPPASV